MRKLASWIAATVLLNSAALGQQPEPAPAAPAQLPAVRVTFIPPPMEGTISLGVYDRAGKLVRVLKREATEKEFTVGLNGLITFWDGKDDAGAEVPPGEYGLRGFSVGTLDVEGIAFHCNDWVIDEESPRIRRMLPGGGFAEDGSLNVRVELADGRRGSVTLQPDPAEPAQPPKVVFKPEPAVPEPAPQNSPDLPEGAVATIKVGAETFAQGGGKVWRKKPGSNWQIADLPGLEKPVHLCAGDNTLWVIDAGAEGTTVREYNALGDPLRELAVAPGEPNPVWMDARGRDQIALLEESPTQQRIRILSKAQESAPEAADSPEVPTSTWRTLASRTIRFSDTFEQVAGALGRPEPVKPDEQTKIRLLPNSLYKDQATEVTLSLGFDQDGAFLKSSDGLSLVGVTETKNLRWAVMSRGKGSKSLTIFQGDGAVVEEFKVGRLANMMAFDAGDCDWPPPQRKGP